MNGHKQIRPGAVAQLCLLIRRLVQILRPGIFHLVAVLLQDAPHRQRQIQVVILLLPAVVHGPGICAAMSGIYHDFCQNCFPPLRVLFLSYEGKLILCYLPPFPPITVSMGMDSTSPSASL